MGADLAYFAVSMLKLPQVKVLLGTLAAYARELEGNRQKLNTLDEMRDLFERAVSRGVGLVAFGD